MKIKSIGVLFVALISTTVLAETPLDPAKQWGQWRGPTADGVAAYGDPPLTWSESENIQWKVEIPGQGLSTPIVWGDVVYLQTAIATDIAVTNKHTEASQFRDSSQHEKRQNRGKEHRSGRREIGGRRGWGMRPPIPNEKYKFVVLALDRRTGKTLWQKTVREEVPHEGSHRDGSLAPASPITDGEHIYAFFGSRGLYCLTMQGEVVWEKDLGDMKTRNGFGEGSSPALFENTLVINWDHEGNSFIVALSKQTGSEIWRRDRNEVTSWSTPLIVSNGGKPQVIVSATNRIKSYDLTTGKTIWECGGLGVNCAPTPVNSEELVFAMSGYKDPALLAIRYTNASGELTGSSAIAWTTTKGTSYVPSALLYDDTLYYLKKNAGVLSCVDSKTGKPHYAQKRLDDVSGVYASPVGADGRVYIAGRNGTTYVIKHGISFEVLAINKLEESFSASPAIVGNDIYLRGEKYLYRVGAK